MNTKDIKNAMKWYNSRGIESRLNRYGYLIIEVNGIEIRPSDFEILDRSCMYKAERAIKRSKPNKQNNETV